jgi:hypothetical protein
MISLERLHIQQCFRDSKKQSWLNRNRIIRRLGCNVNVCLNSNLSFKTSQVSCIGYLAFLRLHTLYQTFKCVTIVPFYQKGNAISFCIWVSAGKWPCQICVQSFEVDLILNLMIPVYKSSVSYVIAMNDAKKFTSLLAQYTFLLSIHISKQRTQLKLRICFNNWFFNVWGLHIYRN